jgi:hypothetical protein
MANYKLRWLESWDKIAFYGMLSSINNEVIDGDYSVESIKLLKASRVHDRPITDYIHPQKIARSPFIAFFL